MSNVASLSDIQRDIETETYMRGYTKEQENCLETIEQLEVARDVTDSGYFKNAIKEMIEEMKGAYAI